MRISSSGYWNPFTENVIGPLRMPAARHYGMTRAEWHGMARLIYAVAIVCDESGYDLPDIVVEDAGALAAMVPAN